MSDWLTDWLTNWLTDWARVQLFFCFTLSHWLLNVTSFVCSMSVVSKNSVIYCILTIKFVFLGIAMLNVVLAVFFSSVTATIKLKQLICYSERLSLKFCPFFSNFAACFVLFVNCFHWLVSKVSDYVEVKVCCCYW